MKLKVFLGFPSPYCYWIYDLLHFNRSWDYCSLGCF